MSDMTTGGCSMTILVESQVGGAGAAPGRDEVNYGCRRWHDTSTPTVVSQWTDEGTECQSSRRRIGSIGPEVDKSVSRWSRGALLLNLPSMPDLVEHLFTRQ